MPTKQIGLLKTTSMQTYHSILLNHHYKLNIQQWCFFHGWQSNKKVEKQQKAAACNERAPECLLYLILNLIKKKCMVGIISLCPKQSSKNWTLVICSENWLRNLTVSQWMTVSSMQQWIYNGNLTHIQHTTIWMAIFLNERTNTGSTLGCMTTLWTLEW